jgi:Leucine Rich Repeat (LRR) protein
MNHRGVEAGRRMRMAIPALTLLAFAVQATSAQERNDDPKKTAHLLESQTKAVAFVEKLGGKVAYNKGPEKQVFAVDLSRSKITDQEILTFKVLLTDFPELQILNLSDTAITDAGLAHLKEPLTDLPELQILNLSDTAITDAGLAHLKEPLEDLSGVWLNLSGDKITDAGLAHLKAATTLFQLSLADTQVTDAGVTCLRQTLPDLWIARKPRALRYFPKGVISNYSVDWYSEDLYAMKEPSLWSLSKEDPKAVVLCFVWLPSFDPSVAVRVVLSDQGAKLHAVQLDAVSGYLGGKPTVRKSVTLTREQCAELKRLVDDAGFWSMPSNCVEHGVEDGASYVFEGVNEGKYHVVDANSSRDLDDRYRRYKALCEAMIKLSGLDVMDLWKEY